MFSTTNNVPEISIHEKAAILAHAFDGLGTPIEQDSPDGRALTSALYMVIYNRLSNECGVV